MDTPTYVVPGTSPKDPVNPTLTRVVVIVGILALLVLIAYAFYHFSGRLPGGMLPNDARIVLAADAFPTPAARLLDVKARALVPLTIEAQGTATLVDEALTQTHGYYLLTGPAAGQMTLYRQDRAHPEVGLSQLTSSLTYKFDLSLDQSSGVIAYAVRGNGGTTRIVVLDPALETERDLGEGSRPTVLRNGRVVLFERGGALISVDLASGEEYTLVEATPDAPFAVDTGTIELSVYNASSGAIDRYSIATMTGATLVSSETPARVPKGLVYADGRLLVVSDATDMLVLSAIDGDNVLEIPVGGFSLDGLSLSFYDPIP